MYYLYLILSFVSGFAIACVVMTLIYEGVSERI